VRKGTPNKLACCQVAVLEAQSGANGLRFFGTPAQILARVRGLQRPTSAPVVDARDPLVPPRVDGENGVRHREPPEREGDHPSR